MCISSQPVHLRDRGAGQKSSGRQDTVRYHDKGEETDSSVAFLKTHVRTYTLKADGTNGQSVVIKCSTRDYDKHR